MKPFLVTLCILLTCFASAEVETQSVKLLKPTLENRQGGGLGPKVEFPLQLPEDPKANPLLKSELTLQTKGITIDGKRYQAMILEVGSGRRVYRVGLYTTDKKRSLYRMCDYISFSTELATLVWDAKTKKIVATSVEFSK